VSVSFFYTVFSYLDAAKIIKFHQTALPGETGASSFAYFESFLHILKV